MTTTAIEPTTSQRAAMNAAYQIGVRQNRKFEASDVTSSPVLTQAAVAFAQTYQGDFEYMVEMRAAASLGFLTANQAKGVLNCLMAEARRRMNAKAAKPVVTAAPVVAASTDYASVQNGFYTVVFDAAHPDDRITLRLDKWEDFTDKRTGAARDDVRSVKYLAGADNEADYMFAAAIDGTSVLFRGRSCGPRVERALAILVQSSAADRAVMGAAYAFQSSRCWRCNRLLTVEDSVAGGIGPKCAAKIGAAYGAGAVQAAKEAMARLQAAKEPTTTAAAPVAVPEAPESMAIFDQDGKMINERRYRELFGEDAA